ncbi:MAG: circadian clock protein KaiB [Proteobacteria bacterium]|nr:MAG: circadian clock protein KaiB [Pseudomonadota bacterium]
MSLAEAEIIKKYSFSLFISEGTTVSDQALYNLHIICDRLGSADCEIEIINIKKDPKRAEVDRIMAIPTLVKRGPGPVLRIIGDLSDHRKVLKALGHISTLHST